MAGLVIIRKTQVFTLGNAPSYSIFLQAALNQLRTYCNNNASNYTRFIPQVDIDLPTGNFIFSASAHVYPNTFGSLAEAVAALGAETYTTINA